MELYYYVDKHAGYNDNHVVHAKGCPFLPSDGGRRFLGTFTRPGPQSSRRVNFTPLRWAANTAARWA